jgi:2-keto-3-deoxy-L-rhamnonate aldolase RhmA
MSAWREGLAAGQRGLEGLFIGLENDALVEMASLAGFRYVVLDGEHGAVYPRLPDLLRTARLGGLGSLVRVPLSQPQAMSQALDWGADGILVPGVETLDNIRLAVQFCCYPPRGHRGVAAMVPAARYGWTAESAADRGRGTQVFVQVETLAAVESIREWVKLPDIHGFFVGPSDLSMALGEGGALGLRTQAAIEEVVAVVEDAGRPWGIFTPDAASREQWLAAGAHLVATAVPMLLRAGIAAWRGGARDA